MISAASAVSAFVRYLSSSSGSCRPTIHMKCRNSVYPRSSIQRFEVPDGRVSWDAAFDEYAPVDYTSDVVLKRPVWADPDFRVEKASSDIWNKIDAENKIDRRSFSGSYKVVNGLPRNPIGRTGMCGRGLLGRWGPNHAADPIVTRWKRDETGRNVLNRSSSKPILQFVAIKRRDSGEWALPGGMVDPGEVITATLKREFTEEAMDSLVSSEDERRRIDLQIANFFEKYAEVYNGYVDDPRNTDNAWMETVAYNFHDETGEYVGQFQLHAGDDAVGVKWSDMDHSLQLYASHFDFVRTVAREHNAHW